MKYKDQTMAIRYVFVIFFAFALGCQTGTGLIKEEKDSGSSTHDLRSSDVKVEWAIRKTLKMEQSPLDVEISPDGKWIFVLSRQGNIFVYSAEGELKDVIVVGSHVDQIKVGPWWQDLLLLSSQQSKTVEFLELAFIQNINISSSPFKGPQNAPVVIVVFSDFQ
jgi:WD40 repeat protein